MFCDCYHVIEEKSGKFSGECWGTRERERCYCNGDTCHCTYYPEKRNATIDVESEDENMGKEKTILNTAEMWLKAQEDGKTYVSDCAMYSKTTGYVHRLFRNSAWGLDAWTHSEDNEDKKRELDNLMSAQWHEEVPTMTRAEAESKLGVKIVD